MSKPASTPEAPAAAGWPLASLSLCMLLPSLGTSIANVALPTFTEAFGASFQQVQWVVLAYLLATTSLIVGAGRLGDLVGRRRLLLGGIGLFLAASVGCATASTLPWLIAARAAQGAGAAVMLALTMTFVAEVVPRSRTGSAMGLLGTMSAVGTALGPSLGGALIAAFGWPALFWVNGPLGLLALALAWRCLPADTRAATSRTARFDLPGTALLAATLGAYALAMTLGRGRFGALNLALLGTAAAGAALFVWVEGRAASPLIPIARLREPVLRAGLAMSALVSTVVMATLVVGPFYLARGLGLDTAWVGLALSVGPAMTALTGVPAGKLVDRFGAPRITAYGLAGMAAGCIALGLAPSGWGVAGYVLPVAFTTLHYAVFQAANNTAVMKDVAADQRGVVSGLLNLSRNLGLITGASVMGSVFAFASGAADVGTGMRVTFAVSAVLVLAALAMAMVRAPAARRLARA